MYQFKTLNVTKKLNNTSTLTQSHQKFSSVRENSINVRHTRDDRAHRALQDDWRLSARSSFQRCACAVIGTTYESERILLSLSPLQWKLALFYLHPCLTLCRRVKIVENASKQHVCVLLRNQRCIYDIFCFVINVFSLFSLRFVNVGLFSMMWTLATELSK